MVQATQLGMALPAEHKTAPSSANNATQLLRQFAVHEQCSLWSATHLKLA
jgi:hypothetical protein